MPDERTKLAVEAAAKKLHEEARERDDWTWDDAPDEWKEILKNSIRPLVKAALEASEKFLAEAAIESKPPMGDR